MGERRGDNRPMIGGREGWETDLPGKLYSFLSVSNSLSLSAIFFFFFLNAIYLYI